jgi:hypothetical protein
MLETNTVIIGDKSLYQLKNIREIHELLRIIKNNFGFVYPEKSYNDLLFDEMLKRETYIVPIYQYSIPVLIYMCYYHNNPCVFIISLESLETIYILPVIINIEFNNILIYGELLKDQHTIIHIERVLYIDNKPIHFIKYVKQIELLNKFNKMLSIEWILPKQIYNISEMEKLVKECTNILGIRFYSFKNPVIFYKNTQDLSKKVFMSRDIKLLNAKEHWIIKENKIKNTDTINILDEIDINKTYNYRINAHTYGIYKVYNSENKEMGILRLNTLEEHNELSAYMSKYKNIEMNLKYNSNFKKWVIAKDNIQRSIIRGY